MVVNSDLQNENENTITKESRKQKQNENEFKINGNRLNNTKTTNTSKNKMLVNTPISNSDSVGVSVRTLDNIKKHQEDKFFEYNEKFQNQGSKLTKIQNNLTLPSAANALPHS